ncbi:MAG: ATP-dependent helicase [Tissierellia bacterium]|nr:ATP-dependent helicase [Tissierellia bacterium]
MKLTEEQMRARDHREGPALVLAVPGSGKTTLLLERNHSLIEEGVDPKRILNITFSKAAAVDMRARYEQRHPREGLPSFGTIHGFCYSIVRNHQRMTGIPYSLIEGGKVSKYRILKEIYAHHYKSQPQEEQLDGLLREMGLVKNRLLDPESFAQGRECTTRLFLPIYRDYEAYKEKHRYMDFDDMLLMARKLLLEEKKLLRAVSNTYDYIQLDEGQDTSLVQMDIIRRVAHPKDNLMVVADDDQSIYRFRGADPSLLFALEEQYPQLKKYILSRSFRSTPTIIRLSNAFISANEHRFQKKMVPTRRESLPIKWIQPRELEGQYRLVEELVKDGRETAILYRNHISALGLVDLFEAKDIPFTLRDAKLSLTHHWALKDLRAIYEFAQNPYDRELFRQIYYKIQTFVSREQIEKLMASPATGQVLEELSKGPVPDYQKKNLRRIQNTLHYLRELPFAKVIPTIEEDLDYRRYIENHAKTFGSSETATLRILYYYKRIAKSTKDPELFLGRLKALEHLLRQGGDPGAPVILSTFHGSKGLEFDRVILVDVTGDIIPSPSGGNLSPQEEKMREEDERRLFYVAMTRAKNELIFIAPRAINGGPVAPSPYFTATKDHYFQKKIYRRTEEKRR